MPNVHQSTADDCPEPLITSGAIYCRAREHGEIVRAESGHACAHQMLRRRVTAGSRDRNGHVAEEEEEEKRPPASANHMMREL